MLSRILVLSTLPSTMDYTFLFIHFLNFSGGSESVCRIGYSYDPILQLVFDLAIVIKAWHYSMDNFALQVLRFEEKNQNILRVGKEKYSWNGSQGTSSFCFFAVLLFRREASNPSGPDERAILLHT